MKITGLSHIKLAISTPCYEMKTWSPFTSSLAQTLLFLSKYTDIDVDYWDLSGDSYIDRARNTLANRLLESDRTDLFFIDYDEAWSPADFMKVLLTPVDLCGAGYPCKNMWDFYGVILNCDPAGHPLMDPKTKLLSGHIVPTGFMKINRRVFERLAPWTTVYQAERGVHHDFFGRMPPLGEDGSFNMRCQAAGIPRWCYPDVTITHYGVQGHTGNYHTFLSGLPNQISGASVERGWAPHLEV